MTEKKPPRKAPAKKATPAKTTPTRRPTKAAPRKTTTKAEPVTTSEDADVLPANVFELRTRPGSGRAAGEGRKARDGRSQQKNGSKTSPKAIDVALRRRAALGLRRRGADWPVIAEALSKEYDLANYTNKSAYDDVRFAIEKIRTENVMEYVEESNSRLLAWLMRVSQAIDDGDLSLIETALKIEKRRADLLGLDAARRIQITGADGGPVEMEFSVRRIETDEEAYEAALEALNETLGPPKELPG